MIRLIEERCIGCGTCATVCPTGAISVREGKAMVDEQLCTACEACVAACPQQALAVCVSLTPVATDPGKFRPRNDAQDRVPTMARTTDNKPTAPGYRTSLQPSPSGPRSLIPPQHSETPRLIPAVGAILGFAIRELVPRLTPYLLDLIDPARTRPGGAGRRTRPGFAGRGAAASRGGRRGGQCRRWRAGRQ